MYFQTAVPGDLEDPTGEYEVVGGVLHQTDVLQVDDVGNLFSRVPAEGRQCANCKIVGSS
jgi:hypothetical protein